MLPTLILAKKKPPYVLRSSSTLWHISTFTILATPAISGFDNAITKIAKDPALRDVHKFSSDGSHRIIHAHRGWKGMSRGELNLLVERNLSRRGMVLMDASLSFFCFVLFH